MFYKNISFVFVTANMLLFLSGEVSASKVVKVCNPNNYYLYAVKQEPHRYKSTELSEGYYTIKPKQCSVLFELSEAFSWDSGYNHILILGLDKTKNIIIPAKRFEVSKEIRTKQNVCYPKYSLDPFQEEVTSSKCPAGFVKHRAHFSLSSTGYSNEILTIDLPKQPFSKMMLYPTIKSGNGANERSLNKENLLGGWCGKRKSGAKLRLTFTKDEITLQHEGGRLKTFNDFNCGRSNARCDWRMPGGGVLLKAGIIDVDSMLLRVYMPMPAGKEEVKLNRCN